MSHKERLWISYAALTEAAAVDAVDCDTNGGFPERAFDRLRLLGILRRPPLASAEAKILLRSLTAIGRGNLSVGRILEGHCNALLLIELFGTSPQREQVEHLLAAGAIFGVWNTDAPGTPVTRVGEHLTGKKNFASGIDGISHAIITVSTEGKRQMLLLPVKKLMVDRSWWKPLGMKASGSHVAIFDGVAINETASLGTADSYIQEPWFSAGAIRFLAVQVGGMHALLDVTREHLRRAERAEDTHQIHRVGQMGVAVATGYQWLDQAAQCWAQISVLPNAEVIASANAARVAIERAALDALELAERSVGASGLIAPHPLERLVRDLRTYLRQPNPDGALANVGASVLNETWVPGHDESI
jgi:alkylation response protein AidB-like acyl-CoA dehydrogenase